MHHCTESCQNATLAGEILKLNLNFTFPLQHVTELNVLGKRMFLVAFDKLCVETSF